MATGIAKQVPEAQATSGPTTPPGGPLPEGFRDAIHGLREQAQEEDRRAAEERRRAARRPFSRFVKISLSLIFLELALLAAFYVRRSETVPVRKEIGSILPENSCNAIVNQTYWKIVAYFRAEGHPPSRLDDLVPKYLQRLPVDPDTGKSLSYSTEGERFQIHCPEITAKR